MTDLVLEQAHGFYRLIPVTVAARAHVAARYAGGLSPYDGSALLSAFFGDAATAASWSIREGFSLQWGETFYPAGEAGADILYDEVG